MPFKSAGERLSRPEDQRGAVIPIVVLCLVVLATATAMSVDIGREVAENRYLQRSADALAMDTVRAVDGVTPGCSNTQVGKAFNASAARNGISTSLGATTYATYTLGTWDPVAKTFSADPACPNNVAPNAVQVTAVNGFTNTFGNVMGGGSQTLQRSATASDVQTASMSLDTSTLAANVSGPAILNQVNNTYLGNGNASVTAAGYQGLASTTLTLGQLATAGNYASVNDLMNADLTIQRFASVALTALNQAGQSSSAAAVALSNIAAASGTATGTFKMKGFVGPASASSGYGSAAGYSVYLLPTLMVGGQIADGQNFVNNNFGVTVPVTDPTTGATVGSATITSLQFSAISAGDSWDGLTACPTGSCSYTKSTSQVTLQAVGMQFTISGVSFNLSIGLSAAQADGYVHDIYCAAHTKNDENRDLVWWNALNGTLNGGTVTLLTGPVTLASNSSLGVVVSAPSGGQLTSPWFGYNNSGVWGPPAVQTYSAGSYPLGTDVENVILAEIPTLATLLGPTGEQDLAYAVNDVVQDVSPAINLAYGEINVGAPNPPQCGVGNLLVK